MIYFSVASEHTTSKTVSLDEGNDKCGWVHIKNGKDGSFDNIDLDPFLSKSELGLSFHEKIRAAIKKTAEAPLFVYRDPRGLEFYSRNGNWIMKVIVNETAGNIVTAMPITAKGGNYDNQLAALTKEMAPLRESNDIATRFRLATLQHLAGDFLGMGK